MVDEENLEGKGNPYACKVKKNREREIRLQRMKNIKEEQQNI